MNMIFIELKHAIMNLSSFVPRKQPKKKEVIIRRRNGRSWNLVWWICLKVSHFITRAKPLGVNDFLTCRKFNTHTLNICTGNKLLWQWQLLFLFVPWQNAAKEFLAQLDVLCEKHEWRICTREHDTYGVSDEMLHRGRSSGCFSIILWSDVYSRNNRSKWIFSSNSQKLPNSPIRNPTNLSTKFCHKRNIIH